MKVLHITSLILFILVRTLVNTIRIKFNYSVQCDFSASTNIRWASNSTTNKRKNIKRRGKKGEGSYSPNLPLIEEATGHKPTGLRIKNIKHINN
jgi:hypothetical protein